MSKHWDYRNKILADFEVVKWGISGVKLICIDEKSKQIIEVCLRIRDILVILICSLGFIGWFMPLFLLTK